MKLVATLLALTVTLTPLSATAGEGDALKLEQTRAILAERAGGTGGPAAAETVSTASLAWRMFQGLGLCLGGFLVGMYLYRRATGVKSGPHRRRMQVLERVPLAGKTALVLAEVDGRAVLLAVGPDRVTALRDQHADFTQLGLVCDDEQLRASA